MATLKAGTYRFNDELISPSEMLTQAVNFNTFFYSATYGSVLMTCSSIEAVTDSTVSYYVIDAEPDGDFIFPKNYAVYQGAIGGWFVDNEYGAYGEGIKTIAVPEDTEVSESFYTWFDANTTPYTAQLTAKITYNGSTIATLCNGQTATLKCEGMKMLSDIVIEITG